MTKCEEYELAASCFVDGELAPGERSTLFDHLLTCDQCADFLGRIVQVRIDAAKQPRATTVDRPLSERPPIPRYGARPKIRFRASTVALVLFSLFMLGVLFSATIEMQAPVENRPSTTITP